VGERVVCEKFKVSPEVGLHRRVGCELLLSEGSGGQLISSRTGWDLNIPDTTRRGHKSAHRRAISRA
jgi:hypothetical protein